MKEQTTFDCLTILFCSIIITWALLKQPFTVAGGEKWQIYRRGCKHEMFRIYFMKNYLKQLSKMIIIVFFVNQIIYSVAIILTIGQCQYNKS